MATKMLDEQQQPQQQQKEQHHLQYGEAEWPQRGQWRAE
jgi:hypothetical protein